MTTQEAIDYINQFTWSQWKLGLERVSEMLRLLGDPQKELRFVHVAGSNGKGSTCAMLERILREAGYVTGFFPSPYIEDFRERIQVCGEYISEDALTRITEKVRRVADAMEDHPTQFELVTAIGMLYFVEAHCNIVVLEVGLGGTYDATNVIDAPEAAVIMHIGLEHTDYLGDTLAEIAKNKCGIIKRGTEVICYPNDAEVMEVVRTTCMEKGCPLHEVREEEVEPLRHSLNGQVFRRRNSAEEYALPLLGTYQLQNAAVVLETIDVLREHGWNIPEEAIRNGLANVRWPARFEVLRRDPLFILDGGHNPQCAEALTDAVREYLPEEQGKIIFLIGMLGDKDVNAVLDLVLPYAHACICVTPSSERAMSAAELASRILAKGAQAEEAASVIEGVEEALAQSRKSGAPVIAFGSLYMAGEIRKIIMQMEFSQS